MKKKVLGIFVCMLLIAVPVLSVAGSVNIKNVSVTSSNDDTDWWPMFHHDQQNSGYSTSEAPEENILIWKYQKEGTIFSSPVVADGKVYVGSGDWNLYCLDADDGSKLWNYKTNAAVDSAPAVVDGKVYFGSNDGGVYCLDANDGSKIWQYTTGFEFSSSPKVYDGKVYVGSERGKMYCLDANDGSQIWAVQTGICIVGSPAIYDEKVYIGSWGHDEVFCLNANNGNTIWTFTISGWVATSPAIVDGKVYVGGHIVYCLNANTGNEIWNYQLEEPGDGGMGEHSCPAVVDGKVYFGSMNHPLQVGFINCLDAEDGSKIWEYPTETGMDSAPAVVDGKVYINVWNGRLYCLDTDDGSLIWKGEGGMGSPAVANKRIYTGGYNVYCYGDESGNQPPDTPTIDGPTSGNNGVEYYYTFVTTDPNGNGVYYYIEWGDGSIEEWIGGPYSSGMEVTLSHTWSGKGTYTLRAKAKDVFDNESDWATLEVSMSKNKAINTPLFSFLENHPNLFQLLQQILGQQ